MIRILKRLRHHWTRTDALELCLHLSHVMASCPCDEGSTPLCPCCACLLTLISAAFNYKDTPCDCAP